MIGNVIKFLGLFFIMATTVVLGYYIFVGMHPDKSPIIPMAMYILVAYVVGKLYISVFQMSVDTILQCMILIEECENGLELLTKGMRKIVDDNPAPKSSKDDDDDD